MMRCSSPRTALDAEFLKQVMLLDLCMKPCACGTDWDVYRSAGLPVWMVGRRLSVRAYVVFLGFLENQTGLSNHGGKQPDSKQLSMRLVRLLRLARLARCSAQFGMFRCVILVS